jgi:hypothetical protein
MAQAKIETRTEILQVKVQVPNKVVLELSLHEAAVLKAMMNAFVGCLSGDRGVASSVWDAINPLTAVKQDHKLDISFDRSCLTPERFTVWLVSEDDDGSEVPHWHD